MDTNYYAPGIGKKKRIPWTAINNYIKKVRKKRVSHYSTLDVDFI